MCLNALLALVALDLDPLSPKFVGASAVAALLEGVALAQQHARRGGSHAHARVTLRRAVSARPSAALCVSVCDGDGGRRGGSEANLRVN